MGCSTSGYAAIFPMVFYLHSIVTVMLAVFYYRRSLIFLCTLFLLNSTVVHLHSPFAGVDSSWGSRLLPHTHSHRVDRSFKLHTLYDVRVSNGDAPSSLIDQHGFPFGASISSSTRQSTPVPLVSSMPPFTPTSASSKASATLLDHSSGFSHLQTSVESHTIVEPSQRPRPPHDPLRQRCSELSGADDVMIAMKTGDSELYDKLPVHFNTTFSCAKHFAVFSDVDREVNGHRIKDVLAGIPIEIRHDKFEFRYYDRLHASLADGKGGIDPLGGGSAMKEDNPAWVLDKWKFLPIIEQAYEHKPDAKWYLFIEADATVVWWNLLGWLSRFDHNHPYYLGSQAWVGETEFGHGGAGYILSNAAVKKLVFALKEDPRRFDRVSQECCGDFVVALALRELVGLKLLTAWPSIQYESPLNIDYSSQHWCHPVITYHHMNGSQIQDVFDFEQAWEQQHAHEGPLLAPITHRDVFTHFVWPHIQEERDNWDNLSTDLDITVDSASEYEHLETAYQTPDSCRDGCYRTLDCVQWSWEPGTCHLQFAARLGDASAEQRPLGEGMRAGWLTERIQDLRAKNAGCDPIWITSRRDNETVLDDRNR